MPDTITAPLSPIAQKLADAKAARIKLKAETKARQDELKKNIGHIFTDGEREAAVIAFEADQGIGSERGDAFLVNYGNPNRHDFVFCADFLSTFKPKE